MPSTQAPSFGFFGSCPNYYSRSIGKVKGGVYLPMKQTASCGNSLQMNRESSLNTTARVVYGQDETCLFQLQRSQISSDLSCLQPKATSLLHTAGASQALSKMSMHNLRE